MAVRPATTRNVSANRAPFGTAALLLCHHWFPTEKINYDNGGVGPRKKFVKKRLDRIVSYLNIRNIFGVSVIPEHQSI